MKRYVLKLTRPTLISASMLDAGFWSALHTQAGAFLHRPVIDCNQPFRLATTKIVLQHTLKVFIHNLHST